MHKGLTQIGRGPAPAPVRPVAPIFFLVAALAGLIGIGHLGASLWLYRSGALAAPLSYATQKHIHALLQFYLYFGLFIMGFVLQAGMRMVAVTPLPLRYAWYLLLGAILGVLGLILLPNSIVPAVLLSLSFGAGAVLVGQGIRNNPAIALFLTAALVSFAAAPWFDLAVPMNALVFFWSSVAAAIFGAGQQFVTGPLRGERITGYRLCFFIALYALSVAAGFYAREHLELWNLFGLLCVASVIVFVVLTRLYSTLPFLKTEPLAPYLFVAFVWACIGAVSILGGPAQADFSLHILATGWGMTLLFGIGTRILSMFTGGQIVATKTLLVLTGVWQLVPIGRGFGEHLPSQAAWVTSVAAGGVYIVWMGLVLRSLWRKRNADKKY